MNISIAWDISSYVNILLKDKKLQQSFKIPITRFCFPIDMLRASRKPDHC